MDSVHRMRLTRMFGGILLAAGLFHIGLDWRGDFALWLPRIRDVATYSALERGAVLSVEYDETDAAFLRFLRTVIPPEGRLLVPAGTLDRAGKFRNPHLLEYHLFPIEIVPCSDPSLCLDTMDARRFYLLDVNGYPPAKWSGSQDTHTLESFRENLGVYVPVLSDGDGQ
jgi:hypothetical protein